MDFLDEGKEVIDKEGKVSTVQKQNFEMKVIK